MFSKVKLLNLLLVFIAISFVKVSYAELTIAPSGNVGIGTVSPTYPLHIEGATQVTGMIKATTDSSFARLYLGTDNGDNAGYLINYGSAHSEANKLALKNRWGDISFFVNTSGGTAVEKVTIDGATGNVGIGTTNPSDLLTISGPQAQLTLNDTGSGFSQIQLGADSGGTKKHAYIQRDYLNGLKFTTYGSGPNMIIDNNGNVGIGTASPTKKLYVNGSAGGTQSWNASDRRWKKDIQTIPDALKGIMKIRGVQYNWKDGSVDESTGFDDKTHYGVIAQEVEAVFPYLVDNPGESGEYKHVEYNALMGILIEAVKELKTENDTIIENCKILKEKNEQLRKTLVSLTDRQKTVESMLLTMSSNLPKEKLVMK